MKYMLLLYQPDTDWLSVPKEEVERELARHEEFIAYLAQRGRAFSGEALQPTATATTLRPEGSSSIVSDGPYVELKEHVAGFYIVDADDLDEAVEVAKRCPIQSGIEVRPIWETASG